MFFWSVAILSACTPFDAASPSAFYNEAALEEAFPGSRTTAAGELEIAIGEDSSVVVPYVVQEGWAVTGGDILLGDAADIGHRSATVLEANFWDCTVPYAFDASISGTSRANFLSAIEHWEAVTPLRFEEDPNAVDRIHVRGASGCSAQVGRQGGAQRLTLSQTCTRGNAIHEVGHAVGLWHEQSRLDAAEHVEVHWNRIATSRQHNFRSWEQRGREGIDRGEYDIGSLMQYGSWSFKPAGSTCTEADTSGCTITTVDGAYIPAQRDGLSPSDIAAIDEMYGHCGAPTPVTPGAAPLPFGEELAIELTAQPLVFELVIDAPTAVTIDVEVLFSTVSTLHVWQDGSLLATGIENPYSGGRMLYAELEAGTYQLELAGEGSATVQARSGRVHGYADDAGDPAWLAVMELVNTGSLQTLDDEVGLDVRAATSIHESLGVTDLQELDGLYYVGASAFDLLFDHVAP